MQNKCRYRLPLIIAAAALCLSAAGCSSSESGAETETRPESAAETTQAAQPVQTAKSTETAETTTTTAEPENAADTQSLGENIEPNVNETKIMTEEDKWHELDRSILTDDTCGDDAPTSEFIHYEIGGEHEGVKYFLEYIDDNNFYITFDNSGNTFGRCIRLFIYDTTRYSADDEVWSIGASNYYIAAGETVTKQYPINGGIKEDRPLQFGIAIDDRGFNYYQDRANVLEKSKSFNLDITYYAMGNSVDYHDIDLKPHTETLPDGFNNIRLDS